MAVPRGAGIQRDDAGQNIGARAKQVAEVFCHLCFSDASQVVSDVSWGGKEPAARAECVSSGS